MEVNLISVLVPCYNTERYLRSCIESILNQTYKNIEVIIVNDGSTDGSLDIINEYALKDSRIVVVDRKENKGVAYSRNEAIQNAHGDYITFVDSDDIISPVLCEKLMDALVSNNADISMCHIYRFYEGEDIKPQSKTGIEVYNQYDLLYNLFSKAEHLDTACGKLYTRKALSGIEYPVGRIFEDSATTYKIFCNVDKAVMLEDRLYYYLLKRKESIISSKYTLKKLEDNFILIRQRYKYLSENISGFTEIARLGYIRNIVTLLDRVYLSDDEELINSDMVKTMHSDLKEIHSLVCNSSHYDELIYTYKKCSLFFLLNDRIKDYSDMIHFVYKKKQ